MARRLPFLVILLLAVPVCAAKFPFTVLDQDTAEPLQGASVKVGLKFECYTNERGECSIEISNTTFIQNVVEAGRGACYEPFNRVLSISSFDHTTLYLGHNVDCVAVEGAMEFVLVLDKSSSMQQNDYPPTRMDAAKTAAKNFVGIIGPSDKVGVVGFASSTTIYSRLTINVSRLVLAIDGMHASGATGMEGGVRQGLNLYNKSDVVKAMLLLSDGCADAGDDVLSNVADAQSKGVKIFTIGIGPRNAGSQGGSGFCEDVLVNLANQTGGEYFYAPTVEDLRRIFFLLQTASKGVRVTRTNNTGCFDFIVRDRDLPLPCVNVGVSGPAGTECTTANNGTCSVCGFSAGKYNLTARMPNKPPLNLSLFLSASTGIEIQFNNQIERRSSNLSFKEATLNYSARDLSVEYYPLYCPPKTNVSNTTNGSVALDLETGVAYRFVLHTPDYIIVNTSDPVLFSNQTYFEGAISTSAVNVSLKASALHNLSISVKWKATTQFKDLVNSLLFPEQNLSLPTTAQIHLLGGNGLNTSFELTPPAEIQLPSDHYRLDFDMGDMDTDTRLFYLNESREVRFFPDRTPKLRIVVVPLNWSGSSEAFELFAKGYVQHFLESAPIGACPTELELMYIDPITRPIRHLDCAHLLLSIKNHVDSIGTYRYNHILGIGMVDGGYNCANAPYGVSNDITAFSIGNINPASFAGRKGSSIATHELGHLFGLEDEYCSNLAGSKNWTCNDGGQPSPLQLVIVGADANPLSSELFCDPTGAPKNFSDPTFCCNRNVNLTCGTVGYGVCCEGNRNSRGGRCAMSYVSAAAPRDFCDNCLKHLNKQWTLRCDV